MPTILILALVLAVAIVAAFVALCLAIRREDRCPRLTSQAPSAGTAATRRISGLYVRRPDQPAPTSRPGPSVVLWPALPPPESDNEGR